MVCENVGATWLPFRPWRDIKGSEVKHGGKVSHEAIWTNGQEVSLGDELDDQDLVRRVLNMKGTTT
jgi:hypothetical protein